MEVKLTKGNAVNINLHKFENQRRRDFRKFYRDLRRLGVSRMGAREYMVWQHGWWTRNDSMSEGTGVMK